jgi:hypothetical protein
MIGAGLDSCETWTAEKGRSAHVEYEAWVLGYISAFNRFGLKVDGDVGRTTDGRGILAWMDRYCADHPLERVYNAVVELIDELRA